MEQGRSRSESHSSICFAVVDAVPVLESDVNDLASATDGDRDAVELPVFTEGTITMRLGVGRGARERQQVICLKDGFSQEGSGVALMLLSHP